MTRKIIFSLLSSLIGSLFIYSAYAKSNPIEAFEYTFVDLGLCNWKFAAFVARFFIIVEFFLGILLLFNFELKRFTTKFSFFVILFFSFYLIWQLAVNGNKGNCGCFGTEIYMSPLKALFKNILIAFVLATLFFFHTGLSAGKYSGYILAVLFCFSIGLCLILIPFKVHPGAIYQLGNKHEGKLETDSIKAHVLDNKPIPELNTGKHVIAFLSLTCSHCRIAAKKIHAMWQRNKKIPFYLVLTGKQENMAAFFDDTHTQEIPHNLIMAQSVYNLVGYKLPVIFMTDHSQIEIQPDYIELNQEEVEKWLKKPN